MFSERNILESTSSGQVDFSNNDKFLENDKSAIHLACKNNKVEIVRILIDKNCDLEVPDEKENLFPIHYVCINGNVNILQILLDKNCSIESLTRNKMRPIHFACRHGHYEITEILIDKKCNINVFDQNKMYPIHYASRYGHFDIAKLLVDNKCNINVIDEDFFTPLHYACRRSHADIAQLLIDANINIEAQDGDNWRPLHFACRYGQLEIVKMLIDKKCDINARQANKLCGIHHACNHGYFDIVKLLIETGGCDIEMSDKKFQRPIHFACANGDVKIVKLLIEHKCNIDSLTIDNKSPLKLAQDLENQELIDIIEKELLKRKEEKEEVNSKETIESMNPELNQMISLMELKCEDNCDHKFCPKSLISGKFIRGKEIGRGTYGKVYRTKGSGRNSTFALKYFFFNQKIDTKQILEKVNKDLNKLKHENLVQYFGAIEIEKHLCVFMEFVSGKSLDNIIKSKKLTDANVIPYSKQMLEGLQCLHANKYIHRDIKPENILVTENNCIKLVDFDFCRLLVRSDGNSSIATTYCGTHSFLAPEIVKENSYTYKADIWSLGATVFNMLTGTSIFRDKNENEVYKEVCQEKGFDLSKCDIKPRSLKVLIISMLENEPSKRPSCSDLLRNEIFTNQDWILLD